MKVFVTGAGGLLGQGLLRSLFASSLAMTPVAFDPEPLGPGHYWTPHRSLIPYARDPSFTHELTLAVEREKPNAILIGSDVELPVVAAHRPQLERDFDVQVVVSSPEMVGSPTTSTAPTSSWSSIGSTPLTCLAGEEGALLAKVGYPVVVKSRQGLMLLDLSVALPVTTQEVAEGLAPTS